MAEPSPHPSDATDLLEELDELERLRLLGALDAPEATLRLHELANQVVEEAHHLPELRMEGLHEGPASTKALPWPGAVAALVGAVALGLAMGRWGTPSGVSPSPTPTPPGPSQEPSPQGAIVLGPEGASRIEASLTPSPRPSSPRPSPRPEGRPNEGAPTPPPHGGGGAAHPHFVARPAPKAPAPPPRVQPSAPQAGGPGAGPSPAPSVPGRGSGLSAPPSTAPHPHWAHPRSLGSAPPAGHRAPGAMPSSRANAQGSLGPSRPQRHAAPAWPQAEAWHEVQAGESLWAIAQAHSGSGLHWGQWWAANRAALPDPDRLAVGQRLQLPSPPASAPQAARLVVRPGDTLSHLALRHHRRAAAWPALWAANRQRVPNPHLIRPGLTLVLPPSWRAKPRAQPLPKALGQGSTVWVTVRPGDTLWAIAKRSYGTGLAWRRIHKLNHKRLTAPEALRPGQVLRVR